MHLDVKLARKLFAELAQELDDALLENDSKSKSDSSMQELGSMQVLDAEAKKMSAPGGILATSSLAEIKNDSVRIRFQESFALLGEAAGALGVSLPDADAFQHAGYDFLKLAKIAETDKNLVLVAAPYGLGLAAWQSLFRIDVMRLDSKMPLDVARELQQEFILLDRVQQTDLPQVQDRNIKWTLRLIPAAPKPEKMGLNYAVGPHPALPEMLMLQAIQLLAGGAALDQNTFTWIAGKIAGDKLAARHVFDVSQNRIIINSREIGNQGPHLGARPPKW
ncbi:MAG TPA: hypothetical protein VLZ31_02510 [Microbacteriaceae bacterium]|nr:hypothetical protein [Microbacteriaceae bacterium]